MQEKKIKYLPIILILPSIVVLCISTLYPFIYNLHTSLFCYNLSDPPDRKPFIGIQNYVTVLYDESFWASVRRAVYFIGGAVSLEFLLGFGIALLLGKKSRFRDALRIILMIPMMLTPVTVALMFRIMLNPSIGIVNYVLSVLGLPTSSWASSSRTVIPTLILVDAWQWTPFVTLIIYAGLLSIPIEPLEAARVDGASTWQTLKYLIIPWLRPVFTVALLFRVIDAIKTFDIIFAISQGGPGDASQTLNIYTYFTAFTYLRFGYASALAIILLILVILTSQFIIRFVGGTTWEKIF